MCIGILLFISAIMIALPQIWLDYQDLWSNWSPAGLPGMESELIRVH